MQVTKVSSIILTPKQHKFCLKYVESGNASLAYREVYDCSGSKPSTVSRKAKELLDNGKITAKINELCNMHQQRHQVTIDSLSNQLDEDRDFARQNGHSAALPGKEKPGTLLPDLGIRNLGVVQAMPVA